MFSAHSSGEDLFWGVLVFVAGFLLFWYREDIGNLTGVTLGLGGSVSSPTPGRMLVPFALVFMLVGALMVAGSLHGLLFAGA